ncbi:polyamine ABC transporter substrate-binding protein [Pseudonocardia xinjiangensis]|uniref:polyamine ABC transporter substrate-binding protein n=1 Tax=Pseudonocardia xinjiangensis TaxID=75289 RepID=UPI003D90877E
MTLHDLRLSRRNLLGAAGALSATAFLAACGGGGGGSAAASQLDIYSWADYFAQDNLTAFTTASGITPKITTYDSNDTLSAKLNSAAGTGFDLVVPTSGWITEYASRDLVQKIDHSRLNLSTLDPSLLDRAYDPHNQYSVPKDWGLQGVIYDPRAVGGDITTWQNFLDAGERPGVQGKIRLSASGWENVGVALWADGKDWNTTDQSVIRAAGDRMKDWVTRTKPQFTSSNVDPIVNGSIVLAIHDQAGARRAIEQNPALRWSVPGPTSQLWVDSYAIPKDAPHLDAVYSFLNYELTEKAQITDTRFLGYPTALAGLRGKLPPGIDNVDLIFGGAGVDLSKLTTFVVNPDTIPVYQEIQTELHALS